MKCFFYQLLFIEEMKIKTNLIEEYVNFVDNTRKQNTYSKIVMFLFTLPYIFVFVLSLL